MEQTEDELEAQLREVQAKLDLVRAANREAAIAEVKDKIRKYSITRTELAAAFPVLRRSSSSTEPALNKDGSVRKRRGRRPKQQAE